MASPQDAQRAVEAIGAKYGYVGEDIMKQIGQWSPSIRQDIEKSMRAKDKLAAHSIKTLAQNIYGSNARFVFELLQNADDNRFTRAKANGALPSISFHLHPHRIVVECNEDGFTEKDLRAICSVGESTKSASRGYIGAKGIGFKSVFIAAWKVVIQSGHFSFHFKHEKGDLGLGMVLPVWENQAAALPGPLTRMTLHLHEQGEAQELEHLRQTIFRQLSELQNTSLLFLRNLRQISVAFYDEDGGLKSSKNFRVGDERDHAVLLETASTSTVNGNNGQTSTENKQYHVTRHMATNLSKSDNRDSPTNAEAEVVLAFPLTSDLQPLIEQQEIFAFLPIRESNFKFLIHSDFDTSASRQDIVSTSLRNRSLIDGIAAAFIKAVLQFCEHPSLCYTWPRFLPSTTDESIPIWSTLVQRIKDLVSQTPILKSRHKRGLRMIRNVHIITDIAADHNGASLFDDSVLDPFISTAYKQASVTALKSYGLRACEFRNIWNLLQADLASPQSKLKSPSTSEDWHSAVARLLASFFTEKVTLAISSLRLSVMLPLKGGLWVAANDGVIYLPATAGISIPPGVKKHVLDPTAVANADRRALFEHLGAVEASVSEATR
ncbi:Protein NO VEIN like protein [Verticillium longisporum]|nr:Protein NO VEIN like protein [Verticillium longisporum]